MGKTSDVCWNRDCQKIERALMRIGIDCRLSGIEHAGIGRYIEELVRELVTNEDVTWVLFFQKQNQLPWLTSRPNVVKVVTPIRHYTLREQALMPNVFAREHLDLLHVPHFNVPLMYRQPYVVTIHDLLWHDQRGENMTTLSPLVYAAKYRAYKYISSQAISRAKQIIVPAETVKQTILTHIPGTESEKISVTYEGVDASWFSSRAKADTKSKILFYTGSLYPHKNVLLVVRALKQLPEYKLYISSSRNVFVTNFMKTVRELGLSDRVEHLGRLTDQELRTWYGKSMALVQPSLSEGFGLTGVEAMASGLPVLASDIPIFREIYKSDCTYFDPMYEDSFVRAVEKLENKDRRKLIKDGIERAGNYSWKKMAEQTLSIYKEALGR